MSKSKFIHTLLESKNTFALEQKVIVVSFLKNCCVFIGTPGICVFCDVTKQTKYGRYNNFRVNTG